MMPLDDQFSHQLAAYDDALAAGTYSLAVGNLEVDDPSSASELRGAEACLRLLEQKWPRSGRGENGAPRNEDRFDPSSKLWTSASTAANRFQLKRKLGEGGHGVVFLAFDTVLEREVALKLPRPETVLSESAKRRFLREARTCAALDHPNLVAVYDAGDAGPFCYIAEAYCDGPTLSAWLKRQTNPVDPQLAAEIVRTVADAVACAHRAGILHRDIKPANVLLEPKRPGTDAERALESQERAPSRGDPEGAPPPCPSAAAARVVPSARSARENVSQLSPAPRAENPSRARPGGSTPRLRKATDDALGHNRHSFDFTPKLTDFGLAKHTDSEGTQTETVTLAGTVPYMAPEQAAGRRDEIGFPTDVYALGVTLFELLTRRKPFEGDTAADTLRRIVSEEPASLRRLRPDLPRDLEAICVRCLERAPSKRYPTASALALDLTRFLEGRPTHARPVGPMGHAVKWSRRNRGWAAAIALFLVAGTALPAAAVWSARSQAEEQRRAGILQQLQNVRLAPHRVTKITNWLDDGLAGVREAATIRTDGTLRDQAAAFLSGPTAHLNKWMSGFLASSVAFDAAGRRVLIGGSDADEAKIWDSQTDEIVQTSGLAGNGPVLFRPNGDAWQVVVSPRDPRALRLWNVDKRELVRELRIPEKPVAPSTEARAPTEFRVEHIVLTPDGHFAAASAKTKNGTALITVWDAEHGKTIRQIETADRKVTALALSPDGRLLAAGDEKGRLVLWTLPEAAEISVASAGSSRLNCLAFGRNVRDQFHPDRIARWLIAGGDAAGRVTVWDLGCRAPRTYCQGTYYDIAALAFCPDGTTLASTGRVNTTLWDIATGRPLVEVQCSDNMTGLAISPDGRKLACSMHQLQHPPELAHEGLQVWDLEYERGIQNLRGLESPIAHTKVQFSDDGSRVAALSIDWRVAVWDRRTGFLQSVFDVTPGLTADNTGLAFSHDGRKLAVSVGHEARMWDLETGQSKSWRLPEGLVDTLAFDATDTHLYLLRMETADRNRAPDNSSPVRSYPRVCRVRDLLAAPDHHRVATPPNAVNPFLGATPTALREGVREFGFRRTAARAGALAFRLIAVNGLQGRSRSASTGEGTCPRSPFYQLEIHSTQFPDSLTALRGRANALEARSTPTPSRVPTLWQTDFFDGGIFKAQASRDGRYFFVLGDHGREQRERFVKVFDGPSGKELLSWPSTDFQLEATSSLLAVYLGKDGAGTHCLVKCPSGESLETLERGPIAIGPRGRLLAFNLSDSFGFALSRREGMRPAASPLHLVTLGIDLMAAEGRPTFSLDGTLLAWGNQNGTVSVCDIPEIQRRLAGLGLGW